MITNTFRANQLYTAYCAAVGGVAFNGDPLPTWEAFEADPTKAKQVAGWIAASNVPQNDTLTDDEKITAILAPYLEKMLEKENSCINEIGFFVSKKDGAYVPEVRLWIFCKRIKPNTLADVVPTIEAFDPAKRAREEKLAKIKELKRELAALEPKEVA